MRFSINRQRPGMVLFALLLAAIVAPAAAQTPPTQPAKPAEGRPAGGKPAVDPAAAKEAEALMAMYRVPETDSVDELLAYIDKLRHFEPRDIQTYKIHHKQMPRAVKAAAERIMALEKDKSSVNYIMAGDMVLMAQLSMLDSMTAPELKALVETIKQHLSVTRPLDQDYRYAFHLATTLERTPFTALAADAYGSFGKAFAASGNPEVTQLAKPFEAAARRLSLVGKPIEVFGATVDGRPFNWKPYAGKVVLVDFWFTDCPPCRAEIPNVKRLYRLYHDRGFEVIGVSVDESREKLETFIHDEQIPWDNVFDTGKGDEHPLAEYYGVITFPVVMLVGKDGKVVSIDARGERLEEWLTKLLGPSGEKPADPKNAKGPTPRAS